MSKTALGAAVGSLVCDGSIKSLDDEIGLYSVGLRDTPYSKILIRNVLQMNSGVTPLNREDVKLTSRMAIGTKPFTGNADVLSAVRHLKGTDASKANSIIIMPQTLLRFQCSFLNSRVNQLRKFFTKTSLNNLDQMGKYTGRLITWDEQFLKPG